MRSIVLALVLAVAGCAPAAPKIIISDAWARATAPVQSSGAVYATLTNAGGNDRLVGVHTPAGMAMLHGNDSHDGIARMRMLPDLPIPPHGRVILAPGGTHVMLTGLSAPLVAGEHFSATFRFAASGEKRVDVIVTAPGAR